MRCLLERVSEAVSVARRCRHIVQLGVNVLSAAGHAAEAQEAAVSAALEEAMLASAKAQEEAVSAAVSRPPASTEEGRGSAAGVSRPPAVPGAGGDIETGPRREAGGSGLREERRLERTRSRWPKEVCGESGGLRRMREAVRRGMLRKKPARAARMRVEMEGEPKAR